ncbi:MAG: nitronate monooxygenase, partial [Gammaproteobacteria bacterium]
PVSIINTPYIERIGTKAGPLAKWMLRGRKTKHWMRTIYTLQSLWTLKRASLQGMNYKDYFQAGKSVEGIRRTESVAEIIAEFSGIQ